MANEKSRDRKTETSILDESAKKRKDSVFVEEVAINESGRSLIISDQFSNENHSNSNNSLFGDSILKDINIKNFNSRLCKVKCRCRFFGGATSNHFHHYIRPNF